MGERKWTDAQLEAISSDSHDLLVSAAAGSGKTAVLTTRIINKITSPDNPTDISRMLVVTFTKAAAKELKDRIYTALSKAISKDPSNRSLKNQLVLLGKAKISTIDGFCFDLIKSNYEKLGLSPNISVCDEIQSGLLAEQVASTVIDSYYAALPTYDDIPNFADFADNFVTINDEKLTSLLISVYKTVSSYPEGTGFIKKSADMLKEAAELGFWRSTWGKYALDRIMETAKHYSAVLSDACEMFLSDIGYVKAYHAQFKNDLDTANLIVDAIETEDYDKLAVAINGYNAISLKPIPSDLKNDRCDYYKLCRSDFKDEIAEIKNTYFRDSQEIIKSTAEKSYRLVLSLWKFVSAFEKRFLHEKQLRGVVDFFDIERLAFSLLIDKNGEPSDAARAVSSKFDEIYIDEYQDVNRLQDMIFSAVACRSDRFMVGDIKQSIYGFRGAEPSLFAEYRANDGIDKVYLSNNFRCDKEIIDFTNLICGGLFTYAGKTVNYNQADDLVFSKAESSDQKTEIILVNTDKRSAEERRKAEAFVVADRIRRLTEEGYNPRDIVILLRSASRSASYYEQALSDIGIPSKNQTVKDLFMNPEVLLLFNILNVIDNPSRDIYLAGTLKSPVFDFSISELIEIRNYSKKSSLYSALKKYCEDTGNTKCRFFLDKLSEYKKLSLEPVDKLVWQIICDTQIFSFATGTAQSTSIQAKKANLYMFYDYARSFENGGFKGLYSFVRYITDIINSDQTISSAPSSSEKDNYVKIMTIHQSKGLEFPVVFLGDAASSFSNEDSRKSVIIEKSFGTTLKLSDETGLTTYDTVFRKVSLSALKDRNIDEEIRVLYVALTRAINKLVITAADTKTAGLISNADSYKKYGIKDGYELERAGSYIKWILMTAAEKYPPSVVTYDADAETSEDNTSYFEPPVIDPDKVSELEAEFRNRFSFVYPSEFASTVPAKLAISDLYPSILDDEDTSARLSENRARDLKTPKFLSGNEKNAAEIGTATHQFMQFCDYSRLTEDTVDEEISRLLTLGFIDSQMASLIDRRVIRTFTKTKLFEELRASDFIKRELRFNVRLPASAFTSDEHNKTALNDSTVLVQGIMDCVYKDANGKLTILDYKTDRVPFELKKDIEKADKYLTDRHLNQLSYYFSAFEKIFCKKADRVILYSFDLGRTIEVTPSSVLNI